VTATIRPAREDDLEAILGIAERAWERVFEAVNGALGPELATLLHGVDWRRHHASEVRTLLTSSGHARWVAETDGAVVGFASAWVVDPSRAIGEVEIVGVEPAAQRRGVGAALMQHAETWLREQGMAVIFVGTGADDGHAPARALYDALGYQAFPVVQYYKALGTLG
jgi:GNAT superfamily N-acetyltransferase